jgi:hypothetical protein
MSTEEIAEAIEARVSEIAEIPDVIERTTAATDLLAVIDAARTQLANAYGGSL